MLTPVLGAAALIARSEEQRIKCLLIWQHPSGSLKYLKPYVSSS